MKLMENITITMVL